MKMRKMVTRGRLAWLLSLVLVGIQLSTGIDIHRASADPLRPAPTSTGYFIYVTDFYGQGNNAYYRGYNATIGGNPRIFILDFGRQWQNPTTGNWGVNLIHTEIKHSINWVISVAQAFIDGYNDNPSHPTARIAIGTNNSDHPWVCDNPSGNVDPRWYPAGQQWGTIIANLSDRSRVTVFSANDIEDWFLDFHDWGACGVGTRAWFAGYMTQTSRLNYDFGENPRTQRANQWTQDDVWYVAWGAPPALVLPQIFCNDGNPPIWAGSWSALVSYKQGYMWIDGVSSENALPGDTTTCGGPLTLSWQTSWNRLHTALTNAGWEDRLLSTAISYRANANSP